MTFVTCKGRCFLITAYLSVRKEILVLIGWPGFATGGIVIMQPCTSEYTRIYTQASVWPSLKHQLPLSHSHQADQRPTELTYNEISIVLIAF
jgi:hypothetical protein